MTRIDAKFAALKAEGKKAFVSYVMAGDPDYETYIEKGLMTGEVSLENAVTEALQKRPELLGLQTRLESLGWSLKVAKWDRWPMLTAECDYNIFLDSLLRERDAYKNHNSWSAAARLTFPIFDAGVSKRRQQSAEIAIEQAMEDVSARKRSIALEVQQTYLSLERARKSLEIAGEQVKNATENLNVTMGRYEQNIVIFLEVLSAQAQYTQALTNQVNAFYDYKVAEKSLQRATGTLQVEEQ